MPKCEICESEIDIAYPAPEGTYLCSKKCYDEWQRGITYLASGLEILAPNTTNNTTGFKISRESLAKAIMWISEQTKDDEKIAYAS